MIRLRVRILFNQHHKVHLGGLCISLVDLGIMAWFVIGRHKSVQALWHYGMVCRSRHLGGLCISLVDLGIMAWFVIGRYKYVQLQTD